MSPSIFLGLVTHKASRFTEATKESGLIWSLDRELRALGVETTVVIHDEDRYTPEILELTPEAVRKSIDAELRTEREWRLYLNPSFSRARLSAEMLARRVYRRLKFAPPWKRTLKADDPGARMLRRLINIELAHLTLLNAAEAATSQWALILEDDAYCDDPAEFAANLVRFVTVVEPLHQPKYVNVSRSFNPGQLGVNALLVPVGMWDQDSSSRIMSSRLPFTNTVCAILYRESFLNALAHDLASIPVSPVIPIDWKLNRSILRLLDRADLAPGDCWTIEPGPIVQGSFSTSHTSEEGG